MVFGARIVYTVFTIKGNWVFPWIRARMQCIKGGLAPVWLAPFRCWWIENALSMHEISSADNNPLFNLWALSPRGIPASWIEIQQPCSMYQSVSASRGLHCSIYMHEVAQQPKRGWDIHLMDLLRLSGSFDHYCSPWKWLLLDLYLARYMRAV